MDFRVLGPVEVGRDGARVHIGSLMQRRLLATLLVHAGLLKHLDVLRDGLDGDVVRPGELVDRGVALKGEPGHDVAPGGVG